MVILKVNVGGPAGIPPERDAPVSGDAQGISALAFALQFVKPAYAPAILRRGDGVQTVQNPKGRLVQRLADLRRPPGFVKLAQSLVAETDNRHSVTFQVTL